VCVMDEILKFRDVRKMNLAPCSSLVYGTIGPAALERDVLITQTNSLLPEYFRTLMH